MTRNLEAENQAIRRLIQTETLNELARAASRPDEVRAELSRQRLHGRLHAIYYCAYNLTVVVLLTLAIAILMILCGTANAAINCSVPAEVGLGDVIHGQIVLHLRSNKGFSWNVQEQQSGRAVTWDPGETQNCSEPCTEVFPWRYTADANLETFYAWQSPQTSDTCDLQITSIEPYQRGTPIPKYVKDAATNLAGNYDYWNKKIAWAGLACLYPGFAETAFGGGYCVIGAGLTIALGEQSHNLTEMAKDPPWPDQCYTPQDTEWVDAATLGIPYAYSNIFGDGGVEYYYNLSVANAIRLHAWRTMAVKEANAASGCLELQDLSNADWHIDRARWAVSAYGDEAGGLANNLWAIGWYFANYWNPAIDYNYPCDASNWQYYSERPDVEQNDYYGPNGPMGTNGAIQHYYDYGYNEGMTYHVELCPAVYWADPINNDAWLAYLESQQVRP